ncbi:MAG: response regulator [Candidatus Hodarchaeales archaeon]|jgi:DNA-binding NarL/FixJ family response regulator
MNVIIVEDSKVSALNIKTELKKLNIEVIFDAENINDLKEKLEATKRPDFVTMDMALPDGDGVEGCAIIWEKFPEMPIIMITIDEVSDELKQKLGERVKDYIIKPVREDNLKEAIKKI